jgi:hypothetical protein
VTLRSDGRGSSRICKGCSIGGVGAGAGRGAGAGAEDGCEAAATPLRLAGPAPEDGRRPRGRAQKGHAWVLIGDFHFCSGATVID